MNEYKPISRYGVIGNLRSVALVGCDGSIDWCCFPQMDSPSVFAALLDAYKGGRFQVRLAGASCDKQYYSGDTNVLVTEFSEGNKRVTVTDMMPVKGDIHGCGRSSALPEIHRLLKCLGEDCRLEIEWSPRFDYARTKTRIERKNEGWLARDGKHKMTLAGVEQGSVKDTEQGDTLLAAVALRRGEQKVLITRWDSEETASSLTDSLENLEQNLRIWEEWAHKEGALHNEEWAGAYLPLVIRSELVFKLLSHADTGAVVAAPTTSLPEVIGGVRNWDYRYTWIRDASLTVQALTAVGHEEEAVALLHWMEDVTSRGFNEGFSMQIMYGPQGEAELEEEALTHLAGYRYSRPVRIGNMAARQLQLGAYGEVLNTGYELARRGKRLSPEILDFLRRITNYIYSIWEEPDHGIWEIRANLRHYTYSKVMVWVAFDRAIKLAEQFGLTGGYVDKWRKAMTKVRKQILDCGFNKELNSFVLSFDSDALDAANLRIPLLGFLPFDDPRVQGTIDRIIERLTVNGCVYRYRIKDGLPGKEGAFSLCTFWLINTLAMSGRVKEARKLYEQMLQKANHVGLFSEQIDPDTGEFLGNFPQAFTHIGVINSSLYLAYAEGRKVPEYRPVGGLHTEIL